ncbi:MAG: Pvc16 family protein [Chloroflexota bacterium]|nr:DUF4255 domain-containing protein [Chloroflexota bacterium]
MIEDLDETIRQLLIQKMPLNTTEVDISFDVPDREWSGSISKPTINIYLHDIRENLELRQTGWNVARNIDGTFSRSRPPGFYDMSYLITAWTTNVEDEHRLLWYVLATMVRYPVIPAEVYQGVLVNQNQTLSTKIAQPDGVLRNVADVWTALENQLKPVLPYVVTVTLEPQLFHVSSPVRSKFLRFYAPDTEDVSKLVVPSNGNSGNGTALVAGVTQFVQIGGQITEANNPGKPVRAEVVLVEQGLNVRTNAQGYYTFNNLIERSEYTLLVVAPGYVTTRRVLTIPTGSYDLELQPEEIEV